MTAAATSRAVEVTRAAVRLRALGELRTCVDDARLVSSLASAAHRLTCADDALGASLRSAARRATGLSPAMIEWCLATTLATVTPQALASLCEAREAMGSRSARLCAVVLAGNVFTAALRAVYLPLLSGAPVLAKAASTGDVFAHHLVQALVAADAELGRYYELVHFARAEEAALDALLDAAEVASVYGDDATVAEVSARASGQLRIVAHGHGLSALYLSRESLASERDARDLAERAALDIAAYDQRGCLSPHFVFVEPGGAQDAGAFARLLFSHALPRVETLLPRGTLTTEEKAACLQWRAVAATRGELLACATHAVSYEPGASPRPSPGARHIAILDCPSETALPALLSPFVPHLKSLGLAASRATRARLAALLAHAGATPHLTPVGQLQTPAFTAPQDGRPPLFGLLS